LVYGDGISSPLVLRMMDQFEGRPLAGTEGGRGPVFSPDGQWIAYNSVGSLKKVPVTGGASITLFEGPQFGRAWGDDDNIVFGSEQGLMRVSASGGAPQALTKVDAEKGETAHESPQFLPGRNALRFTIATASPSVAARIAAVDLKTGSYRVVVNDGELGRYVPTGHLVYLRGRTLFAAPFDAGRLVVMGSETPVIEGVGNHGPTSGSTFVTYSFSETGLLVYVVDTQQREGRTLEWLDRKGSAQASNLPPRDYGWVRIWPDGKRAAVRIRESATDSDIWIGEPERGTLTRLTFGGLNVTPVWTPDGRRVAFSSPRGRPKNGIYWAAADGSGKP